MVRWTVGSTNGRGMLFGLVTENSGIKAKPTLAILANGEAQT
jgi:hypothetical protein